MINNGDNLFLKLGEVKDLKLGKIENIFANKTESSGVQGAFSDDIYTQANNPNPGGKVFDETDLF